MSFPVRAITLALSAVVCTSAARAEVEFSSAPHVLAFSERQQIVLFSGEDAAGAMATRRADGTFDVIVPDAQVAPSLLDRDYFGPPHGEDGAATSVSLAPTSDGDVRIRIRPAGRVARVVAYPVQAPARLMIDLLPRDAEVPRAKTRVEAKKKSPRTARAKAPVERAPNGERPAGQSAATKAVESDPVARSAPKDPKAAEPIAASPRDAGPERPAGPNAKVSVAKADAVAPSKDQNEEASAHATRAAVATIRLPKGAPFQAPMCRAPPEPKSQTPPEQDSVRAPVQREADVVVASGPSFRVTRDSECRFLRVFGVPFCAADSDREGYRDDPYAAGVAHRIAAGATWLAPIRMPKDAVVQPLLAADREFIVRASDGWLLPAVAAYERAGRIRADFPGVVRAHMNIALIYYELGFGPELVVEAQDPTNPARDFARAVLGDFRRNQGRVAEAAALYESASEGSPLAVCFAARGLAAVALAEGRIDRAMTGVEALADLCPREVVVDADTERIRARVELAAGEPDRALATLSVAAARAAPSQLAEIARARAEVAETSGRIDEARDVWMDFKQGRYGKDLVLEGVLALARIGDGEESIEIGLEQAAGLPVEARERVTKELFNGVSEAAMAEGDHLAPLSVILAADLEPKDLNVPAQIALAASYRRLGLLAEAERLLDEIGSQREAGLPESYWEETGKIALARGDFDEAQSVLQRWRTSRGGNPSSGELRLRVELLAREKAPPAAIEALLVRLEGLDAGVAEAARWDAARLYAATDPNAGLAFLGGETGVRSMPNLPDEQVADTLWQLGRASEKQGATESALVAFGALGRLLPATARGADASYRVGRMLEGGKQIGEARQAYRRAGTHPDALDRRFADAAAGFHQIVQPWTRRQEE